VIAGLTDGVAVNGGQVRLDQLLRQTARNVAGLPRVELMLVSYEVPDPVAESFAQALTKLPIRETSGGDRVPIRRAGSLVPEVRVGGRSARHSHAAAGA
jgi:hypothetical protein